MVHRRSGTTSVMVVEWYIAGAELLVYGGDVVHRRSGTTSVVVVLWCIAGAEYIVWWWCGASQERNT